ncbi:MAG: M67 family metallopeptidase [Chloroflexota bacterium]
MTLQIQPMAMQAIRAHGRQAYPEEGAGFLLGMDGEIRTVAAILPIANSREDTARHNRYLISAEDYLRGEVEADRLGLTLLGIFHSHPDHPNRPSEYDREWAQPFFSYLITSVMAGQPAGSRSWRLREDRSDFVEEQIQTLL